MEDEDLFTYGVHGGAGGDAQEVEDLGCEDVEAAESLADDDCEVQEDQLPPVGPTSGPEGQEPAARGRGNGRERGRGPRGINKSRGGSVVGRGKNRRLNRPVGGESEGRTKEVGGRREGEEERGRGRKGEGGGGRQGGR